MTLYISLFIPNIARLPLYGQTEGQKEPKCRCTLYISKSFKKRIYIPFYNQQYENTTHTTMLYFFFISEEIGSPISSKKKNVFTFSTTAD